MCIRDRCDIDNLRDCFAHINGTSNAFNGYIDKFYSTQIFNFNIQKDLVNAIDDWFDEIGIRKGIGDEFYRIFIDVIKKMISCGSLNIRSLTKMQNTVVDDTPFWKMDVLKPSLDYMGLFFSVLQKMFVGDQEVANAIHLCYQQNPLFRYSNNNFQVVSDALCIMYPKKEDNEDTDLLIDEKQYLFRAQVLGDSSRFRLMSVDGQPLTADSSVPIFYFIEQIKRKYLNI